MSISVSRMQQHHQQQQQQQHHINQLLSTAATGNGVVHDVDALLAPMSRAQQEQLHQQQQQQQLQQQQQQIAQAARADSRPERNLWRNEEIHQMLNIMEQLNAIDLLNDKCVKSEKVFREIEELMHMSGYRKKSHVQIWTKWKFLKSTYMTSRRSGLVPRLIPFPVYERLHKMLNCNLSQNGGGSNGSISASGGGNSECGNSVASMDGDSSNGPGIVIAGVEGGYTNGKEHEDDNDSFGMAHPIFGFRLGMVKQEPMDTGYETITDNGITVSNNSNEPDALQDESNSTTNIQLTVVKQEATEEEPTPMPVPLMPPRSATTTPTIPRQRQKETSSTVSATSTPRITPSPTQVTPQMPPLRIAPFAKDPNGANALANCPSPPPLSIHPVNIASRNVHCNGSPPEDNIQNLPLRKILPKPKMPTSILPIRLPREITIQNQGSTPTPTTTTAALSANMPRLKQVPMRKTPYSLRPERVIPDLDEASLSPPTSSRYAAYQDAPSTSRQNMSGVSVQRVPASTTSSGLLLRKRKRRLDIPWSEMNPGLSNGSFHSAKIRATADDDDDADDVVHAQRQSFKAAQQQQPVLSNVATAGMRMNVNSNKNTYKEQESYENALKELGNSLRRLQREMISDFFEQQMQMARQEHEFQMKQDVLIMQAFEQQTHSIMNTARDLLGMDLKELLTGATNKRTYRKANHEPSKVQKAKLKTKNVSSQQVMPADAEAEDEYDNRADEEIMHNINEMYAMTQAAQETYEGHKNENSNHALEDEDDGKESDEDRQKEQKNDLRTSERALQQCKQNIIETYKAEQQKKQQAAVDCHESE